VVAVVALPADAYGASIPRNPGSHILLLEDVQDPGNVGALIRCAAAFDYSGVLLTEKCADPFSAKAVLASAGTLMTLWIRRGDQWRSILDRLIDSDFRLLVADASGEPVAPAQAPFILAAGNEGAGVSPYLRARAHAIVSIPINTRRAESLNVSVAGALCMYGLAGPRG
jgi:TrmH family RNA methyltransferase